MGKTRFKGETRIVRNGCLRRIARGKRNESENPKDDQVASSIEQSFHPLAKRKTFKSGTMQSPLNCGCFIDMLKKTLLSLILMNVFVLTAYYGTDMLNVCGTNVRLF